jgi:hypothetical protein
LLAQNTLCVAQGDCGAWVNIKGKGTTHGFIVSDNHPSELSASDVNEFGQVVFLSKKDGEYSNKFSAFFKKSWFPLGVLGTEFVFAWEKFGWEVAKGFVGPVQGTVLAGFGQSLPEGFAKGALYKQTAGFAEGLQAVKVSFAAGADPQVLAQSIQSQFGPEAAAAFEQSISQQVVGPMGPVQLNSQMVEKAYYDSVPKGQTSTFLGLSPELLSSINTVMWIWTIYSLVDVLFAKTSEETYSVECQPWVAPVGGSDCESCGDDGKECSEYRCKSLGQLCKLVNPGTKKEMCINSHPNDVAAPVVSADVSALEKGYTLNEKAGEGYTVSPQIEPFTAVSLGIKTNEPSQCKYSVNHSISYDQMTAYFGDSLYDYNHTITFSVPDEFSENEELLKLTNGGQFKFFVRCQDGNGNQNEKDYYITFAVKKGPDLTPPVIELTSIANGAFMPANVNSTYFVMYVNEPSTCKWNDLDADYDDMLHSFSCSTQGLPTSSLYYGLYDCATVLDGIDVNSLNKYYFRCKDQPNQPASEQNVNQESYLFTLKGTVPLEITSVSPETGSSLLTLSPELKVVTSKGAQGGHAVCGYSFVDDNPANAIDFLFTNSTVHTQTFANLTSGSYTAHITCVDAAGNYDQEKVTFSVAADTGGPQIAQVYTEGNLLFLVTNEASTCEYSTTGFFTYGSGVQMTGTQTKEHQASLDSDVYYIICQDNAGNLGKYTLFV